MDAQARDLPRHAWHWLLDSLRERTNPWPLLLDCGRPECDGADDRPASAARPRRGQAARVTVPALVVRGPVTSSCRSGGRDGRRAAASRGAVGGAPAPTGWSTSWCSRGPAPLRHLAAGAMTGKAYPARRSRRRSPRPARSRAATRRARVQAGRLGQAGLVVGDHLAQAGLALGHGLVAEVRCQACCRRPGRPARPPPPVALHAGASAAADPQRLRPRKEMLGWKLSCCPSTSRRRG